MSANNQTLIKEFHGKFYVFTNVMAETWCEWDEKSNQPIEGQNNRLSIKGATGVFDTRDEALTAALKLEKDDDLGGTEYGIWFDRLCKDDGEVVLIE